MPPDSPYMGLLHTPHPTLALVTCQYHSTFFCGEPSLPLSIPSAGAATPVININSSNSTAVMFSWMLKTDGVSPTGFMLNYTSNRITPTSKMISSGAREYTVSSLQPGDTLNISLVAFSEHLPSKAATESVTLGFQRKLSITALCIVFM